MERYLLKTVCKKSIVNTEQLLQKFGTSILEQRRQSIKRLMRNNTKNELHMPLGERTTIPVDAEITLKQGQKNRSKSAFHTRKDHIVE